MSIRATIRHLQEAGLDRQCIDKAEYVAITRKLTAAMPDVIMRRLTGNGATAVEEHQLRAEIDRRITEELPTDLQNGVTFFTVTPILDDCRRTANVLRLVLPANITLATLWGGDVNGFAFGRPPDEYAIVLDETLIGFADHISRWAYNALSDRHADGYVSLTFNRERLKEQIQSRPDVVSRYIELMGSWVFEGTPRPTQVEQCDSDVFALVTHGFEYFVLAHELGHLHHGHVDDPLLKADKTDLMKILESTGRPLSYYRQSKELEADVFALNLLLQSSIGDMRRFACSVLGAWLFLLSIEFLQRAIYFFSTGSGIWDNAASAVGNITRQLTGLATHPHPLFRRQWLQEALRRSNVPQEYVDAFMMLTKGAEDLFLCVEEAARPTWESWLKAGALRVHSRWHFEVALSRRITDLGVTILMEDQDLSPLYGQELPASAKKIVASYMDDPLARDALLNLWRKVRQDFGLPTIDPAPRTSSAGVEMV